MNEQNSHATTTPEQPPIEWPQLGWNFWILWVLALTAAGAVTYCLGALLPFSGYVLPPASLAIFGALAGAAQRYAFRQQLPLPRRWFQASALAGLVAAVIGILPTGLAETSAGLYAGWAYTWAVYGAALGVALERVFPGRKWILVSLAGWATAGVVSGVIGWFSDVMRISGTTELLFILTASLSRNWSIGGLIVAGAACGAIGGAITGVAMIRQPRQPQPRVQDPPQDSETVEAKNRKLTLIAGSICGLAAAVLCTFVAPLIVTALLEGSLESLDVTIFLFNMLAGSPLCLLTYAVVSVPLGIAGGRAGLEIARARGGSDVRRLIWCGAALGGIAGYLLGLLVAFAIGHTS